jgi:type I restriction enzyme S subunit
MEVRPGYKLTEAGVIPNDWEVVPLGALVQSVEYGSSAPSKPKGNVPVLRMGNLQSGMIDWQDLVFTNDPAEIQRYELHEGDVLFNRTNTIDLVGKTSIYEGERKAIFAGYLIRVVTRADKLDAKYLNFVMNTDLARKHSSKVLSVAVGQANINGQKLRTYPIPLPPTLLEQRAIAAALSDVDLLLGGLDRLIAKKRDLKQAAIQQLLTGRTRLPGHGVPWQEMRTAEAGEVLAGKALDVGGAGPMRPYLRTKNVLDGRIETEDVLKMPMTNAEFERFQILPGDVLLNEGQSLELVGRCSMYKGELPLPCAMQNQLLRFRAYAHTSAAFATLLFRWCQNSGVFAAIATQTTSVAHLGGSRFSDLRLRWPTELAEQTAIAEVLCDMDAELTALEARRDKTRDLKQAMMQELLTGKTRLM